jgi:hypothetical protein
MILSASRRTDIPCYYSDWFVNRLRSGYVLTRNPMNHAQIHRINLSPETIDCIVFWTKDPVNMLDKLHILDEMGYKYYFQFTLTPYGKDIERNLRDKNQIIDTFILLSESIGKEKVLWRYDPIILNEERTISYHKEQFESLCSRLSGHTEICTISFVDIYSKLINAVKSNVIREITRLEMHRFAEAFAQIGQRHGVEVRACCEKTDLSMYGIKAASCIDQETVEKACGYPIKGKNDANQRPGCGCIQSIDIGIYNTCRNGCIYCYANYSDASVAKNLTLHDPSAEILIGTVRPDERILDRKIESLREEQTKLF